MRGWWANCRGPSGASLFCPLLTLLSRPTVGLREEGGSARTPAALAPSRPRSAFSVSSGLTTDVPSLRSAPALGARGGGVGGGWHPTVDVNASGQSQKFRLVWVKKSEGLCFGNVGEHRFCRATECKIRKHQGSQGNKFDMGCDSGWFIASKSQALSDKAAAVKTHFLDAAKITDDTLSVLQDTMTRKTTAEWETFIAEANVEWEGFVTRRPFCVVEELSLEEELEDNDSFESTEGNFIGYLILNTFEWRETLQKPPSLNIKHSSNINEDIEDLHAIMEDLSTTVPFALSTKVREDAVEVLEYIWSTVFDLIKAVDCLNRRV